MSIYIKGMEMPTGCGVCPFSDEECFGAWKCWRVKDWGNDDNRAKDCPLVPAPPHGRLIDADTLRYWSDDSAMIAFDYVTRSQINAAPTIIPASEEGV